MSNHVLINLPVKSFDKSREFFSKAGLAINAGLTDENAICFDISESTSISLLSEEHFRHITKGEVADTSKSHEILIAVSMQSREKVDVFVDSAVANGGSELHDPQDLGWIYGRTFADLDGHQWNIFFMSKKNQP